MKQSYFIIFLFSFSLNATNNILTVDQLFGSNTLGSPNTYPYQTIAAAIAAVTSGDAIYIAPGTYNEAVTLPSNVSVQGTSSNDVTIQQLGVTAATTLLTMATGSSMQNVSLKLISAKDVQLQGVIFPDGTTNSASLINSILLVSNTGATSTGASSIYGIRSSGTGQAAEAFYNIGSNTIQVNFTGATTTQAYGIMVDGSNTINIENSTIVISGNTGCNGIATNNTGATANVSYSYIDGQGNDTNQIFGTLNNVGISNYLKHAGSNSYLFAYDTTAQTITSASSFQAVKFASVQLTSGWTHSTTTTQNFTCNQTGLYVVTYHLGASDNTLTATSTLSGRLTQNGNEVVGSQAAAQFSATANQTMPLTHTFIMNINSGDLINVQITGTSTTNEISGRGSGTTTPSATLTIVRIG